MKYACVCVHVCVCVCICVCVCVWFGCYSFPSEVCMCVCVCVCGLVAMAFLDQAETVGENDIRTSGLYEVFMHVCVCVCTCVCVCVCVWFGCYSFPRSGRDSW
jgi:hypothetical protein